MSKSDLGLLALNLLSLMMAVAGLSAQHVDPMGAALGIALVTALVNGGVVLRRGRRTEPHRSPAALDELDARAVLDLDARLEALERAHADATDAARWRALAESGHVSGPGAETADEPRARERGHTRNGRP